MALGPISNLGAPPQPAPSRDVSNAQRAFFQAALAQASPLAVIEAPTPQPPPAAPASQKAAAPAEAPKAAYRPGSLLDIRI